MVSICVGGMLLDLLFSVEPEGQACSDYFDLLCSIIEVALNEGDKFVTVKKTQTLIKKLATWIKQHETLEVTEVHARALAVRMPAGVLFIYWSSDHFELC